MRSLVILLLVAAFAGCIETPADDLGGPGGDGLPGGGSGGSGGSSPAPGFAPQQGVGEDVNGSAHLVVRFAACPEGFCLNATATNEGAESYYVSSICVPPHEERMERDGKVVYPRAPMFYCAAFGVREWLPGEDIHFVYSWNGTLWDDASGKYVEAEQGAYQWTAMFHAFGEQGGGDRVTLFVTHSVIIGET